MKAVVREIQVGGLWMENSLESAARRYVAMINRIDVPRTKMHFAIELPNGEKKHITIRDGDDETIAYGDFEGLPNMLDSAKEIAN